MLCVNNVNKLLAKNSILSYNNIYNMVNIVNLTTYIYDFDTEFSHSW